MKKRYKILLAFVVPPILFGALALLLVFGGWWKPHASSVSPDGKTTAISRIWYTWGPMYGWNHYYIHLEPARKFRCISPKRSWRGTPYDISTPKTKHRYAHYNDFDDSERFPTGIKWLSNDEFLIIGGEGDGARFKIEQSFQQPPARYAAKAATVR